MSETMTEPRHLGGAGQGGSGSSSSPQADGDSPVVHRAHAWKRRRLAVRIFSVLTVLAIGGLGWLGVQGYDAARKNAEQAVALLRAETPWGVRSSTVGGALVLLGESFAGLGQTAPARQAFTEALARLSAASARATTSCRRSIVCLLCSKRSCEKLSGER